MTLPLQTMIGKILLGFEEGPIVFSQMQSILFRFSKEESQAWKLAGSLGKKQWERRLGMQIVCSSVMMNTVRERWQRRKETKDVCV